MGKFFWFISVLWCVYGCGRAWHEAVECDEYPAIYPDYQNVTVPVNIAPLNFGVREAGKMVVEFRNQGGVVLICRGKGKIDIPLRKWHALLKESCGEKLEVKVYISSGGRWRSYRPFDIRVAADSIDPFLAYRLIEPGYELGKRLGLFQRELSSFRENAFVSPLLSSGSCVNCHAFCNHSPERLMYHVRWNNSGTVIAEPGNLRKVNTKTKEVISPGSYRMWHPSGKYIAFSNNRTHQAFHAFTEKKIEVYDLSSDMMIYDVEKNRVITDKRFTADSAWQTFPAWSADGRSLYFCEAWPVSLPMEYKNLKYRLYRVDFDEGSGLFGDSIEKVDLGCDSLKSIAFPVVSPDGRYLLYTVAESGTFPIWHKESDLRMIDIKSGLPVDMSVVNSDDADCYHAWASSGRWIAFSSRRDDHLYTRVYIAYFDRDGKVHKPFVLPQRDADFYTLFLKSYNIPEFIKGPVPYSPRQLEAVMKGEAVDAL